MLKNSGVYHSCCHGPQMRATQVQPVHRASDTQICVFLSSSVMRHLGGPQSRAMTSGGGVNLNSRRQL